MTNPCPLENGQCKNAWSCVGKPHNLQCGINYYPGYCSTVENSPTAPPDKHTSCWDGTPCKTNTCLDAHGKAVVGSDIGKSCLFGGMPTNGCTTAEGKAPCPAASCQTKKDGYCGLAGKPASFLQYLDPVCGEDADCLNFQKNGYCTAKPSVCQFGKQPAHGCTKAEDCAAQTCTGATGKTPGKCSGDNSPCAADKDCAQNMCIGKDLASFKQCWGNSEAKCQTSGAKPPCQWIKPGDKRTKCYHQSGSHKGTPTGSPHIGKTCKDLLTEMGSDTLATCAKGYTLTAKGGYHPSQKGQTPPCVFECTPNPDMWRCNAAGSCVSDPLGTYSSQKSCKADCTKTTPSRGNNTALIIILVIVGVLILGVGGFLIYDTTMAK